jgi:predicted nucleotidyltransferase
MKVASIIQTCTEIIKKYLPEEEWEVLLFGSQATGIARDRSDVDIAIHGQVPVPNKIMVQIREEIEAIPTLRSIDIVDLHQTDSTFRAKALQEAQKLTANHAH